MADTYGPAIRTAIVNNLSQFVEDDAGSNIGVGYTGWDQAFAYARERDLDYFGSVFLATGDDEQPNAFNYGMWRWAYYIRLHVKFDTKAVPSVDTKASALSTDFVDMMMNSAILQTIADATLVKVVAANYLGEPEVVNDVTYLTIEFLVSVKEQISRS